MGVNGLWQVLQPCARPTNLATLNRKRLAVDASIWIYQFLKAVRDKEGQALRNSHIIGFFRRICKLLWFGILPVFVFDGGAPVLKRSTLQARRQRREGRREDAMRTAGKLLAVQMQRLAEEEVGRERRKRSAAAAVAAAEAEAEAEAETATAKGPDPSDGMVAGEVLPSAEKIVYAQEMHLSQHERLQARKFTKQDAYHLPELEHGNNFEGMGRPDDPRIMNIAELEEYARQFNAGEDINLYDFSKIDFDGDFFRSLPPVDRYNILNAARLRSRLRMGLSKEQLDSMFPDRMAFSRFQIERVRERNHLTQRLMIEAGMSGIDLTMGLNARIAGERDREYILVKNEGADGGWALGVVSREKDRGQVHKPIDVDALHFSYLGDDDDEKGATNENRDGDEDEDEDEDIEFQDVPIEGLNRLPRLRTQTQDTVLLEKTADKGEDQDEDSLFVASYEPASSAAALLHGGLVANVDGEDEEDADLKRAIAMSLHSQHGARGRENDADEAHDDEDEEALGDFDITAPEWTQKRAPDMTRPILATSGRTVAHIVNNRSNAAMGTAAAAATFILQQDDRTKSDIEDADGDSSDSELDIRRVRANTAKAKRKMPAGTTAPAPAPAPVKSRFGGPLPFEKLDWRSSIFEKRPPPACVAATASTAQSQNQPRQPDRLFGSMASRAKGAARTASEKETGSLEPDSEPELDDLAGGFVISPKRALADQDDGKLSVHVESSDGGGGVQLDSAPRPLPPWMMDNTDIRTAIRQQQAFDKEINAEDRAMALEEEQMWQRRTKKQVMKIDSSDDDSDIEVLEAPPLPPQSLPKSPLNMKYAFKSQTPEAYAKEMIEKIEVVGPVGADAVETQFQGQKKDTVLEKDARPSPEIEFEDVSLPSRPETIADKEAALEQPSNDDFLFAGPDGGGGGDDGLHEFSDPEDEELLAQMAEEVEEHARFASTLNNKTTRENQEAYERELKALRSQQKRDRRDADEVTQAMVSECQALLRLFGIPYITAPMEAEAQCAELVALGLVDGIVTDDSDTFLFGGTRVYKNMFNSNKFVECYLSADLERELSLSRDSLIAMAQLLGSDYAEGLPGVGPVTAMEILSEFPADSGQQGLCTFRDWWEDVQTRGRLKEDDAASPFRRKFFKAHFAKLFLAPGFPSTAVLDAYLKPEADHSAEPFQWGAPDLDGLRSFLMATIGWTQERTDEVLVPVIRDMNRRETEGTQSNITRFFSGAVGTGARLTEEQLLRQQQLPVPLLQDNNYAPRHAPRAKASASSRRMAAAVTKLKAKAAGIGSGDMDAASAAAAVMSAGPATTTGGRKRRPPGSKNMKMKTATGSKRKPEASPTVPGGGESGEGGEGGVARDVSEPGDDSETSFDEGWSTTRRRRAAKKTRSS